MSPICSSGGSRQASSAVVQWPYSAKGGNAVASLREKKLFLLDMDGTIYLDGALFPGTLPFLEHVKRIGGRTLFLTNNSSRSVEAYVERLAGLGIAAERRDFLTSTDALIAGLKQRSPYRLCYAFGTESFRNQLRESGIPVTDRLSEGIDCLLIGFDRSEEHTSELQSLYS